MRRAKNTSLYSVLVGEVVLRPGESCPVADELADRIQALGAGLLAFEDDDSESEAPALAVQAPPSLPSMNAWAPARVANWASKQTAAATIELALTGKLRGDAREALELRLRELNEGSN